MGARLLKIFSQFLTHQKEVGILDEADRLGEQAVLHQHGRGQDETMIAVKEFDNSSVNRSLSQKD